MTPFAGGGFGGVTYCLCGVVIDCFFWRGGHVVVFFTERWDWWLVLVLVLVLFELALTSRGHTYAGCGTNELVAVRQSFVYPAV
ncbi:hypothetical protein B0I37DRAFT_368213, partial [Chaetomium sp. MPI-CAGE-AT-0009]